MNTGTEQADAPLTDSARTVMEGPKDTEESMAKGKKAGKKTPAAKKNSGDRCSICGDPVQAKGLCAMHYQRQRRSEREGKTLNMQADTLRRDATERITCWATKELKKRTGAAAAAAGQSESKWAAEQLEKAVGLR